MTKAYKLCPGRKQNPVRCGYCQGKGVVLDDIYGLKKSTCPVCDGEGEVIIVGDGIIVVCDSCNGKGRISDRVGFRSIKCPKCKGIGQVCI